MTSLMLNYRVLVLIWTLLAVAVQGLTRGSSCVTPNKEKATCIPFKSCQIIKTSLLTRNTTAINFARQSQCGYDSEPLVCCGSVGYQISTLIFHTSGVSIQPPSTNQVKPMQHHLLPKTDVCGIQENDNKIYGGQNTGLYEFPWMTLIRYGEDSGDDAGFKCGGSLINNRYVLTAAHCVVLNANLGIKPTAVRLGEWKISTSRDCIGQNQLQVCSDSVVDVPIQQMVPHIGYRRRTHEHDIALIKMSRSITFTIFIRPICLPASNSAFPEIGSKLSVAGWGATEQETNSDVKLKTRVPVIDRNTCSTKLAQRGSITDDHLCAGGTSGKDSCQGDSGGPLMRMVENSEHGQYQWFLEGIISWGVGCGVQGFPGVYTRVSKYADWIVNNIRE